MEMQYSLSADNVASDTILIVDDDKINRKILGKIFSGHYKIIEAENGQEALAMILNQNNHFCAVLLDLLMPGLTGLEVIRHLHALGLMEKIPVFLITVECNDNVMREAYQLGVMDVIRKPVIPFMVLRRVGSIVELFEARKHLNMVVENQSFELLMQTEKIISLNQGMIEVLATAIEFRNEESGGHVQRICGITRVMLENTEFGDGLDEFEIENIALASIIHDVGKIAIPDAVLTKPGKLTNEEYEVMKTHTIKGADLLESIPQLQDSGFYDYAKDIARHHHERWDGRGYPDGLKGEEISPWSQVVSLADVYDALSCKRVYKDAFPRKQVVEMILTGQCGLFGPRLLENFLKVEDQIHELYEDY